MCEKKKNNNIHQKGIRDFQKFSCSIYKIVTPGMIHDESFFFHQYHSERDCCLAALSSLALMRHQNHIYHVLNSAPTSH